MGSCFSSLKPKDDSAVPEKKKKKNDMTVQKKNEDETAPVENVEPLLLESKAGV